MSSENQGEVRFEFTGNRALGFGKDSLVYTRKSFSHVDPAGRDFHLASGSPCIDAVGSSGGSDFEGDPRPFDWDGDGIARSDIGCDEKVSSTHLRRFAFSSAAPPAPPLASALPLGPADDYVDDFHTHAADPDFGVLADVKRPLVAYDSPDDVVLRLVKSGGTRVRILF